MTDQKTEYCVISHTHWDREWHQSFERFRMKLVDLVDHVLEIFETSPEYIFHLDAQSICVEDYLAVKPENESIIRKHIADGRLLIGPWYVQNDFYLTSGEATVRNLLIGSAMAREYGSCETVGYAPDQFGNPSQLPQILTQFGIDNFVFGRGYAFPVDAEQSRDKIDGPTEFHWQSRDGSSVLAIHLAYWYNNAQRFPADIDRAVALTTGNGSDFKDRAATPYILLMNGVDHLEAQEDLLPILRCVDERMSGTGTIRQESLSEYVRLVRDSAARQGIDLPRYTGELRHGWDVQVYLANTASSRIYLKQANVRSQVLLENLIEPLYTMIALAGAPDLYPGSYLRYLWKTLIKNHAHDSICGCSVDAVHRNMEDRFLRVAEAGDELLLKGLSFLVDHVDRNLLDEQDHILVAVNTLAAKRSAVIERDIYFLSEANVRGFDIRNVDGLPVEFEIIRTERAIYSSLSPINLPGNLEVDRFRVRLHLPSLPALSSTILRVTPSTTEARPTGDEREPASDATIENAFLRLEIDAKGVATLTDKINGNTYVDVYGLHETGDAGHSYEFSKPAGQPEFTRADMSLVRISRRADRLRSEISVEYSAMLPEAIDAHTGRRSKVLIENTITLTFSLDNASPYLTVECKVGNRSRDHRLQLLVNTGVESESVQVAAPFDLVTRSNTTYSELWNSGDAPNSGFVTISNESRGISVLNEGVAEYHHLEGTDGMLAFTLVRGTEFVNGNETDQPDHWRAPENQTLRDLTLRLAIYPHAGDAIQALAFNRLYEFLVPVLTAYDSYDRTMYAGGRAPVQAAGVDDHFFRDLTHADVSLADRKSAIRVRGDSLVVSALKRSEDGTRLIVRAFNPADHATTIALEVAGGLRSAAVVNLAEEESKRIRTEGNRTEPVPVPARGIVTIGFST